MKKIYITLVAIGLLGANALAQRTIDWSVEEIIKPTVLNSGAATGTPFDIEVVLKNNGTNAVELGDSIFYQFALTNSASQAFFVYPGVNSFNLVTSKRAVAVGDTMHAHIRVTINIYVKASTNAKLFVTSLVINRGSNPIGSENTAGLANNTKSKDMIWQNEQGWGVGISDVKAKLLMDVYPNPAQNLVTVSYKVFSVDVPNEVNIYDIQGKLVRSITSDLGIESEQIDISTLPAGLYIVKVKSGDVTSQQKLQVVK